MCVAGASAASPALCYARLWIPCGYAPRSSRTVDAACAVCYARMVWFGCRVLCTHGVVCLRSRVLRTHGVVLCGVLARPCATHALCGVLARTCATHTRCGVLARTCATHVCCRVRARRARACERLRACENILSVYGLHKLCIRLIRARSARPWSACVSPEPLPPHPPCATHAFESPAATRLAPCAQRTQRTQCATHACCGVLWRAAACCGVLVRPCATHACCGVLWYACATHACCGVWAARCAGAGAGVVCVRRRVTEVSISLF